MLQHGLTGNLGHFKLLGYTEVLRGRYRLIARAALVVLWSVREHVSYEKRLPQLELP